MAEMKFKLFGKNYNDGFVGEYGSFRAALAAGQERFGHGKFHIEAPENYVPSREEELPKQSAIEHAKEEVHGKNCRSDSVRRNKERQEIRELRRQILSTKDW